jgi:cytosine/adenosine deaminase-related metal-dependent hydrolase
MNPCPAIDIMKRQVLRLLHLFAVFSVSHSATILFEHGTIISFNETRGSLEVLSNHSLLVVNDTISAIFPTNSTISIPAGTVRISAEGDILSPGHVDTHRHVWQTAHRSIGGTGTLAEYLTRWTNTTVAARIYSPEISYYSELVGLCEAVNAGVTTIVDHASGSFTSDIVDAYIRATKDSGVRSIFAYNLGGYETFPFDEQVRHFKTLITDKTLAESTVSLGISYERWTFGIEPEIQAISTLMK